MAIIYYLIGPYLQKSGKVTIPRVNDSANEMEANMSNPTAAAQKSDANEKLVSQSISTDKASEQAPREIKKPGKRLKIPQTIPFEERKKKVEAIMKSIPEKWTEEEALFIDKIDSVCIREFVYEESFHEKLREEKYNLKEKYISLFQTIPDFTKDLLESKDFTCKTILLPRLATLAISSRLHELRSSNLFLKKLLASDEKLFKWYALLEASPLWLDRGEPARIAFYFELLVAFNDRLKSLEKL